MRLATVRDSLTGYLESYATKRSDDVRITNHEE